METSTLTTYRTGSYIVTAKCPLCRRSHSAGPSREIVHDNGLRERVHSSRVPVPADVKRALAAYARRRVDHMANVIYREAVAAKKAKQEPVA